MLVGSRVAIKIFNEIITEKKLIIILSLIEINVNNYINLIRNHLNSSKLQFKNFVLITKSFRYKLLFNLYNYSILFISTISVIAIKKKVLYNLIIIFVNHLFYKISK